MINEAEHHVLTHYFQHQQTRSGWFMLLNLMVEEMVDNIGEQECHPFLKQIGEGLAERCPLTIAQTLGDLEKQINAQLAQFNWGIATIEAQDNALLIHHRGVPIANSKDEGERWCNAMSAILEGLYGRWLLNQGGASHVSLWREQTLSFSELLFRYQVFR